MQSRGDPLFRSCRRSGGRRVIAAGTQVFHDAATRGLPPGATHRADGSMARFVGWNVPQRLMAIRMVGGTGCRLRRVSVRARDAAAGRPAAG